jgi:hypothetical protein
MPLKKQPDIQAAVQSALQGERLRPAPVGMHRRIEQRVRYVALQDRERRRFRETLAAGVAGIAALGTVASVAAWHLAPLGRIAAETPGARGQLDRVTVFFANSWLELAGAAACAFLATAVLALLLARVPQALFTRLRSRG